MQMSRSRSSKETVQARAHADPDFRQALLAEAVEALLHGEVAVGKAVLRDYINATIGFESLAAAAGIQPKSLMRMFSPQGNPTTTNLMTVIAQMQRLSSVRLEVGVRQHHPST
jgi:DNA-binding phage protein